MRALALALIILVVLLFVRPVHGKKPCPPPRIPRDATLLFWTGGFDSTFRLCELAVEQRRPVQPVYLTGDVDGTWNGRQNQDAERRARALILRKLRDRFPFVDVRDPVEVDVAGMRITNGAERLHREGMRIGALSRPVSQYTYMSQLTTDAGMVGEVCITAEGRPQRLVLPYLSRDYRIAPDAPPVFAPYHYLRFPTIDKTKQDMLAQARRHGYADILAMTWSCWYPKKRRGGSVIPCGSCEMCRARLK